MQQQIEKMTQWFYRYYDKTVMWNRSWKDPCIIEEREREVKHIIEDIAKKKKHIIVTGKEGLGKSHIMDVIKDFIEKETPYNTIHIDMKKKTMKGIMKNIEKMLHKQDYDNQEYVCIMIDHIDTYRIRDYVRKIVTPLQQYSNIIHIHVIRNRKKIETFLSLIEGETYDIVSFHEYNANEIESIMKRRIEYEKKRTEGKTLESKEINEIIDMITKKRIGNMKKIIDIFEYATQLKQEYEMKTIIKLCNKKIEENVKKEKLRNEREEELISILKNILKKIKVPIKIRDFYAIYTLQSKNKCSRSWVYKTLRTLEEQGIISSQKVGREKFVTMKEYEF